ncbi:MAG: acetylornithine/succinylornithine family transaminase [Bacillota bacterium]
MTGRVHEGELFSDRGLTLVRGSGALVYDDQGREYVDCIAGHGVASLGHCNPLVVEAITRQARRLITCSAAFESDVRTAYLERLAGVTPGNLDRFFLCNSGAEAVEASIKLARLSTGRTELVAAKRGFHGRTAGALSLTWNPRQREMFAPLVPGVRHVTFDDGDEMAGVVDGNTAAVILEVVQGEGGIHCGSPEYFRRVRDICEERGALLIIDEVQTGFGRTGRWFAAEGVGVVPDMLCMAKAIAGGLPMGAVALGPRVRNLFPLAHGSTFGGNPLACAAALATLNCIEDWDLVERARVNGRWFLRQLGGIRADAIRQVRGIGLMVGVDLRTRVTPHLKKLQERGVLALAAGATVMRFLPPLVIERSELERVCFVLEEVLRK